MNIDITTQGGRLLLFITRLGLTQTSFAASINITKNSLNDFVHNRKTLSKKLLNSITSSYPQINAAWIEFGIGEAGITEIEITNREQQLLDKITKLKAEIKQLKYALYIK